MADLKEDGKDLQYKRKNFLRRGVEGLGERREGIKKYDW